MLDFNNASSQGKFTKEFIAAAAREEPGETHADHDPELQDNEPVSDITTRKLAVTIIPDKSGIAMRSVSMTLPELAAHIGFTTAASKMALPWLKLAIFGIQRSDKQSLRTNDNVLKVSGIEGDHDSGGLSFDDAVAIIRKANIRALLYTSASHEAGVKERWRILAPLSENREPEMRGELVARINGLLSGLLAGESFTLSQAFLYGHLPDAAYRIEVIDGDFLDLRDDLDAGRIFKDGSKHGNQGADSGNSGGHDYNGASSQQRSANGDPETADVGKIEAALDVISADCSYAVWLKIAAALHHQLGENGFTLFDRWSSKAIGTVMDNGKPEQRYTQAKSRERWRGAQTMHSVRISTVFYFADQADPTWRQRYEQAQAKSQGRQQSGQKSESPSGQPEAGAYPVDPVDLWAKFDPPTLPRGLLPQVIEDFAFDQGTDLGGDMSGIAVGALAVCAAAIPDSIKLQVKKNSAQWLESARLWVALIGDVAAMKTPIMGAVVTPLRNIDNSMAQDNQDSMDRWSRLSKDDQRTTPKPKQPRVMMMDITPEAAQDTLQDSPDGVLLFRDELAGWLGSIDKYTGGARSAASSDRAFWLEAYNGTPYTVGRVTRGGRHIPNLSISMLGGIQPGPIRKIANESVDDGLLQRMTPVMLSTAVVGSDEPSRPSMSDYNVLIRKLHELRAPRSDGLLPSAISLKFDDGALAIRKELEKRHLELSQCASLNRKLASHIGKYNGMFARLCVIWHCVEHVHDARLPAVIAEDTARRVAGFLHGFLLPHALAFYASVMGLSNDHDRLANVADFILAHKLELITNRAVTRGDRSMRRLERREIEAIFEQLEALGWLDRIPGFRPADPPRWVVNPAVHQKFAERADASRKRRERDREVLGKLFEGGE